MKTIIDEKNFSVQEVEGSDMDKWIKNEFRETHPETLVKATFLKNVMDIIASDHHKSKDGGFIISYDYWDDKWYVAHNGYVREAEGEGESFLEAAQNYLIKIKRKNDEIIYGEIEKEVNKCLPDNISCEIDGNSLSINDYSKGIDNWLTIASRKIKGKSIKEIVTIVNELLSENYAH